MYHYCLLEALLPINVHATSKPGIHQRKAGRSQEIILQIDALISLPWSQTNSLQDIVSLRWSQVLLVWKGFGLSKVKSHFHFAAPQDSGGTHHLAKNVCQEAGLDNLEAALDCGLVMLAAQLII